MKRCFDVALSFLGLVAFLPLLVPLCVLIWLQDLHSPFYITYRVGRRHTKYRMVKLRSMVVKADRTGVDSTASNDPRITAIGRFARRYKLDEIPQLWNVLKGEMSFVGPRPNVDRETALYTEEEKHLLDVRPGITDLSSIVFSDEGEILAGREDPDLAYNQLIRPWKSRLGLLYVKNTNIRLDLRIILLTVLAMASKKNALLSVERIVRELGGSEGLCCVVSRRERLVPAAPPGAHDIVRTRMVAVS